MINGLIMVITVSSAMGLTTGLLGEYFRYRRYR